MPILQAKHRIAILLAISAPEDFDIFVTQAAEPSPDCDNTKASSDAPVLT